MTIKGLIAIAALVCIAIISFGCGSAATNTAANAKPANTTAANTSSTTTTTTTNTTTTAPANTQTAKAEPAGDSIGVPECDEYIKKYEACLTKIAAKNPQVEGPLKTSFETLRDSWKKAAATPAGKSALATGCKTALDQAKSNPALSAYACEW